MEVAKLTYKVWVNLRIIGKIGKFIPWDLLTFPCSALNNVILLISAGKPVRSETVGPSWSFQG